MNEPNPPTGPEQTGEASPIPPGPAAAPHTPSEPVPTEPVVPAEPVPTEPVVPAEPVPTEPVVPATHGAPPSSPRGGGLRLAGYVAAAVIGAALLLGGLAAAGRVDLQPSASPSPSPSATPGYQQGAALGDASAPVTIEVWADYQCPYCGLQARAIEPSIERTLVVPGKARLVFRDFAFLGQESIDAAVAARCAGRQDAFWYYHDLLFGSQQGENQGAFARDRLLGLASFAGLDATKFTACLDDATVATEVKAETASGRGLGVTSTPTIRVSGPGGSELLTGVRPLSEVTAAVDRMSRPSPTASPSASPGASAGATAPGASAPASAGPSPSASPSP